MDIDFSSILSDEDLKSGIQSKLFGFSVLCEDSELYRVTWGDQIGVAHVENLHNKRYIKMHYLFGDGYKYDVPFQVPIIDASRSFMDSLYLESTLTSVSPNHAFF